MKNLSLALIALFMTASSAQAFDMVGMISYNIGQLSNQPSNFVEKGNSLGYDFFGRLDLGPGQIESGFLYSPISITTNEGIGNVKTSGSYWMIPLLYRVQILPPFFSLAAGMDYAVEGNTAVDVLAGGTLNGDRRYRSHFGYEISAEAAQDLGENLSAVLDVRYRGGIGEAIAFAGQNTKYNFVMIALGLQKHLE